MNIVPFRRSLPRQVVPDIVVQTQRVEEDVEIQEVSVFAEDDQNGKSHFSILLGFSPRSISSNLPRRTMEITGLALGVEEKEIPVLARLAGRELRVYLNKSQVSISLESLELRISELLTEVEHLREKNRVLSENLHHLMESYHKIS
jgi:hypothetical protein